MEQPTHDMYHAQNTRDGWEVWKCPTCGRCVAVHWWPGPERHVWLAGDETVIHTGGRRNLLHDRRWADMPAGTQEYRWPKAPREPAERPEAPVGAPDERLEPWLRWMRAAGLAE